MAAAAQEEEEMISGINVTPLVDITFVLLIIFMATAHMIMHRAMNLTLPKVANTQTAPTQTIQIVLEADKTVSLNGQKSTPQDLAYNLAQMGRLDASLKVTVLADERVSWGDVAAVLDIIRGAGITRIATEVQQKSARQP
jgi:biopolymer transport protein ExbD